MKKKAFIKKIVLGLACISGFASCAIENDIPYPIVEAAITGMTVEGQRSNPDNNIADAAIDNSKRTVTLYVNDSVDVRELKITQLKISNDALLLADSAACVDYGHFPDAGFSSLDSIPVSSNTRINFSKPVTFTLRTYQDYVWTVTVNQVIDRAVDVDGMTRYVLDEENARVVIYVNPSVVTDLSNVQINTLNLGGEYGETRPENGGNVTDVHDFSKGSQEFYARLNWEPKGQYTKWTVYVYQDTDGGASSNVFPMVSRAIINGSVTSGKTPVVEYKEQNASEWQTASDVTTSGATFTAQLTGLQGSTTYSYRVSVDGVAGNENTFTTVQAVALENGSFENWSQEGSRWNPWAESANPFWGTGNKGSSIVPSIGNLTSPTTESISGQAVVMESKDAILKLGAGNIFTGDFDLDGIDGLLHFGRSFSSFPTSLRVYYKYTSEAMQTVGSTTQLPANLEAMIGRPDSCHIYIALSDKAEPYEIRTKATNRQLFDKNDANIIAYGEFISGNTNTSYTQIDIPLTYRDYRTPRYIIIVCSASKYGDYYLGGIGSTLWLDEMELVYE